MTFYIGLDPGGSSGGGSVMDDKGRLLVLPGMRLRCIRFDQATEHEVSGWIAEILTIGEQTKKPVKACLENVHSMPKQGVSSSFKFGVNYGFLRGLLIAHQIPFLNPPSQVWQKAMKCLTKGDKKVSRAAAHRRWPKFADQINDKIADSLMLAEWMRLYGDL